MTNDTNYYSLHPMTCVHSYHISACKHPAPQAHQVKPPTYIISQCMNISVYLEIKN